MFPFNAAFVMVLVAIAMARVPRREWLSSFVVIFLLGLLAIACQRPGEAILRGQPVGNVQTVLVACAAVWCCFAVRQAWLDLRSPPNPRRRRRGS